MCIVLHALGVVEACGDRWCMCGPQEGIGCQIVDMCCVRGEVRLLRGILP